MAGITDYQQDTANGRAFSMWAEGGLQFRSNLVFEPGGKIPLHAHSYDHVSMITQGWFQVEETDPRGNTKRYQMASKGFKPSHATASKFNPVGYRTVILAGHQHSFTLLESDGPGEVLCVWPAK